MGGSMGVTQGCSPSSGRSGSATPRSPRSRSSGAGIGAAIQGMLPVVEIMYEDFLTISMEQIVNQAAKHRTMSGGQVKVPLTIRTQGGAGWSPGAQHAQQLEAWFVHVPGLKVVFASTPEDVRGLLWSSIYDPNPVIFFEHRTLYPIKGEVPDEIEPIPLGQGARAPRGHRRARSSRPAGSCTRRCGPPRRQRRTASRSRSSTRARCSRSTPRRSSSASRRRPAASRRTRRSCRAASAPSSPP